MWDDVGPTLHPYDMAVLGHLFRLTAGWKRAECKISIPRLAARCNVSENRVRKSLGILEARGLVVRVEVDGKNRSNDDRGIVFRVPMATEALAPREGASPREGGASREPGAAQAPMKEDHERKHETPVAAAPAIDVFGIRTIAARLFEAHRSEQTFSRDRLRELVRDALIGQGIEADDTTVDEAIRGMT